MVVNGNEDEMEKQFRHKYNEKNKYCNILMC